MAAIVNVLPLATVGAGLFGAVGALFGSVAGALARLNDRPTGALLGNAVAGALGRLTGKSFSPLVTGLIVGATDGALFLAVVGFSVGAYVKSADPAAHFEQLLPPLAVTVGLAIATFLLGALAYVLTWGGSRAVGVLFGLVAGAIVGAVLARGAVAHGLLVGVLGGGLLGVLAAVFSGPAGPREDEAARPTADPADDAPDA